jgi:hypothetical protein
MPRTAIAASAILTLVDPQPLVVGAGDQDVPFEDSDQANGNDTPCTGKELLAIYNNGTGAQTVTIDAAQDGAGRDGTITAYSLAEDDFAIFGPFPTAYYRQTDGKLHIDTSADGVQLAVIKLP